MYTPCNIIHQPIKVQFVQKLSLFSDIKFKKITFINQLQLQLQINIEGTLQPLTFNVISIKF